MTKVRIVPSALALLLLVAAVACSQQGSAPANPTVPSAATLSAQSDGPLSATVEFGRDNLGSPFPPPSGHDESGHSRDSMFPQNVVIDKGGTVTFVMGVSGVHEAAIYAPGTTPGDINAQLLSPASAGCPPVPTINDPNHRIAIVSDQVCEGGSATPTYKFNNPGKYLVICTFLPHFEAGMYGYVTVRDR
jgi:plastocyanin